MSKVTFVHADGAEETVDAKVGTSLMEVAVANNIAEIAAECGGACACGTCHCYIDKRWRDRLVSPEDMEGDMIECVIDPTEDSRLSCQIQMTEQLDGIVIRLPSDQY